MAIMIPSFPYGFDPRSREEEMFNSLKKLSDDYYVFYSYRFAQVRDEEYYERETDFIIYNRKKGMMFVEAKAGQVSCENGLWRYSSGDEMRDPFKQADDGRWTMQKELKNLQLYESDKIADHMQMTYAVWFPSIAKKKLQGVRLPGNADINMILTAEDVQDPRESVERIFSYKVHAIGPTRELTMQEHDFVMNRLLCPTFHILPSKKADLDAKRDYYNAMIDDQKRILNYLEYQRSAVINGAAGTGKTLIAVEKAKRHSDQGESVLFLCFNSKLRDYLEREYPYENVNYYTIDSFACKMCGTREADFFYLEKVLDEKAGEFPYQHIIVDEGQDFGQERMNMDNIFAWLEQLALSTENGTFYVFYDKMQMIQSKEIPAFVEDADCRLTLYKNCRNTKKIAETSFRPLKLKSGPKLFDAAMPGVNPVIDFCDAAQTETHLKKIIQKSLMDEMTEIQVLSCAASGFSALSNRVVDESYEILGRKIPFTTVRKFKGLEAEHVILVDVDKKVLEDDGKRFYVGASRAKFQLSVIANLNDEECREVVESYDSTVKRGRAKESLANLLGCKLAD